MRVWASTKQITSEVCVQLSATSACVSPPRAADEAIEIEVDDRPGERVGGLVWPRILPACLSPCSSGPSVPAMSTERPTQSPQPIHGQADHGIPSDAAKSSINAGAASADRAEWLPAPAVSQITSASEAYLTAYRDLRFSL